jgi:hypothetical protein
MPHQRQATAHTGSIIEIGNAASATISRDFYSMMMNVPIGEGAKTEAK